jgi:hypothetical protein
VSHQSVGYSTSWLKNVSTLHHHNVTHPWVTKKNCSHYLYNLTTGQWYCINFVYSKTWLIRTL